MPLKVQFANAEIDIYVAPIKDNPIQPELDDFSGFRYELHDIPEISDYRIRKNPENGFNIKIRYIASTHECQWLDNLGRGLFRSYQSILGVVIHNNEGFEEVWYKPDFNISNILRQYPNIKQHKNLRIK